MKNKENTNLFNDSGNLNENEILNEENISLANNVAPASTNPFYSNIIRSGGVYFFRNAYSGKYLTVNSATNSGNLYQSAHTGESNQAFKFEQATANSNAYLIKPLVATDKVLRAGFSTSNDNSVFMPVNVAASSSSSNTDGQEWMLSYLGNGKYRIVLAADNEFAMLVDDTNSGSPPIGHYTANGAVYLTRYLEDGLYSEWYLESAGLVIDGGTNIADAGVEGSTVNMAEGETRQFFYVATDIGASMSWNTTDSSVATVDRNGKVTAVNAGRAQIYVFVYYADGGYASYYFYINVLLPSGIYFINNAQSNSIVRCADDGVSLILSNRGSDNYTPPSVNERHMFFKVNFLGNGEYSIRSMLDNSMGWTEDGNDLIITSIGTTNTAVPSRAKWKISYDTVGFTISPSGDDASAVTGPNTITIGSYEAYNSSKQWKFTKMNISCHGVIWGDNDIGVAVGKTSTYTVSAVYSTDLYVNGTNNISWSISNGAERASIVPTTGVLTAISTGEVTVRASIGQTTFGTMEVTIYRPAVLLIHGRNDNSFTVWGANNGVYVNPNGTEEKANNHYNSSILATPNSMLAKYTSPILQQICSFEYNGDNLDGIFESEFPEIEGYDFYPIHSQGGNLAYYLLQQGYIPNVNLFAFNYPNQDAVVHNANKLDIYLQNLATEIRTIGNAQQKASFFGKTANLSAYTPYNIDIVGHSMGGLVARYYIENIGKGENIRKLITIDTPHWGADLADISNNIGLFHRLCDHDLQKDSAMYGGNTPTTLVCDGLLGDCTSLPYTFTDELNYNCNHSTVYYAIAGINYSSFYSLNDRLNFEISSDYSSYDDIRQSLNDATDGKLADMDIYDVDDNTVEFLSQIGCTSNSGISPTKKIDMGKIFIYVDKSGVNDILLHLHGKMPHRTVVMEKVFEYLCN